MPAEHAWCTGVDCTTSESGDSPSTFAAWTNCTPAVPSNECDVTLNADTTVDAQFDANGGDVWGNSGVFNTSYDWDKRHQTVDLWAAGYSQTTMAAAPPISVTEQFARVYCPDYYSLKVELLDTTMNVVKTLSFE